MRENMEYQEDNISYLEETGIRAKKAAGYMAGCSQNEKNKALLAVADALISHQNEIMAANSIDIDNAKKSGMSEALIDRLALTPARFESMREGIRQVVSLEDPIGEVLSMKVRPNGLIIGQKRVPLGVVGIIYESRPNVTVDAFALTFKTGNAVILRGGSDCINSNIAIVKVIKEALLAVCPDKEAEYMADSINLIERTGRDVAVSFMKMNKYLDVLIPRGGAGLIKNVVENATVPVIETGTGNCHIYVDKDADLDKAVSIIHNAKLQRLGVCNACESLVIHRDIADRAIPLIINDLKNAGCEIRGDAYVKTFDSVIEPATEDDYKTEYLAKIISVKVADSLDEAIEHINACSTGHSEAIITENYSTAQRFLNEIDSACVYVNASTRFTDGFEFGFGAEIGISTQKLHARGPMGLKALTSTKYIIYGNGQIRE